MKRLENKILKYFLILSGMFILNILLTVFFPKIVDLFEFKDPGKAFNIWIKIFPYFINLLFALILYADCRKETKNYLTIPILGIFVPIVSLMFFFIESYLVIERK